MPSRWDSPPRAGGGRAGGGGGGGGDGGGGGGGAVVQRGGRERERDARGAGGGRDDGGDGGGSGTGQDTNAAPTYGLSGALAAEANAVAPGLTADFAPPPEARVPRKRWRLYVFKNGELLEPLSVHSQSSYVFGREPQIADIKTEHPSCSKQHAALVFRSTTKIDKESQMEVAAVRPYIIDLGSSNGTTLNGEPLPPKRYVELLNKDTLRFGCSSREYTLLDAS